MIWIALGSSNKFINKQQLAIGVDNFIFIKSEWALKSPKRNYFHFILAICYLPVENYKDPCAYVWSSQKVLRIVNIKINIFLNCNKKWNLVIIFCNKNISQIISKIFENIHLKQFKNIGLKIEFYIKIVLTCMTPEPSIKIFLFFFYLKHFCKVSFL